MSFPPGLFYFSGYQQQQSLPYLHTHGAMHAAVLHFESCRRAKITIPLEFLPLFDHSIDAARLRLQEPAVMVSLVCRSVAGRITQLIADSIHPGSAQEWVHGNYGVVRGPGQEKDDCILAVRFEMARGENGFTAREYMGVRLAEYGTMNGRRVFTCKAEYMFEEDRDSSVSENSSSTASSTASSAASYELV